VPKVRPLADHYVTLYASPDSQRVYAYSPGITRTPSGRLVATMDLGGPGVSDLPGPKGENGSADWAWQGRIFVSDDHGRSWRHRNSHPFYHARPFAAGDSLYVLGHCGDLMITRSDDDGDTWSEPVRLTDGERWHQAPCNVLYANECVYLVMEKYAYSDVRCWGVSVLAPVLMRGGRDADLTQRDNWAFAGELPFRDAVPEADLDTFGVPFFAGDPLAGALVAEGRHFAPIGWLEANVVQFADPHHLWHDPAGRTFHLWMRAHTGGTNLAAIAKVVEDDDGRMTTLLETVPSGRKMVYVPCPGGHMKFHILYDDATALYWLLSTQSTDSMTRADALPPDRYDLPNNERHRLQLHFSRNCVDWCFAGLVALGSSAGQSRHYASMVIDGDDLHVLSRSGDMFAKNAHDTDMITLHTVRGFRALVY